MPDDQETPAQDLNPAKAQEEKKSGPEQSAPKDSSEVEILSKDDSSNGQGMVANSSSRKLAWLPWRRKNRRDQQITQLRDGYIELVDLVRNINDHLDRQKNEASQVSGLVQSLPPVLASFEKLADSQQQGTAILGRIDSHMEKTRIKDEKLLENMEGFNLTMKDLGETNRGAMGALERVGEKISSSDERMGGLFDQATKNSDKVGKMMMRLEKRLFVSNLALIILLAILIGLGIYWSTRSAVESTLPTTESTPPPAATSAANQKPSAPIIAEVPPPLPTPEPEIEEPVVEPVIPEEIEEELFIPTPAPEDPFEDDNKGPIESSEIENPPVDETPAPESKSAETEAQNPTPEGAN